MEPKKLTQLRAKLIVDSVEESIRPGRVTEEKGYSASRNKLQTTTKIIYNITSTLCHSKSTIPK